MRSGSWIPHAAWHTWHSNNSLTPPLCSCSERLTYSCNQHPIPGTDRPAAGPRRRSGNTSHKPRTLEASPPCAHPSVAARESIAHTPRHAARLQAVSLGPAVAGWASAGAHRETTCSSARSATEQAATRSTVVRPNIPGITQRMVPGSMVAAKSMRDASLSRRK